MITFKKIRWKNILSTGNSFIELDLNSNHTNLLIGDSGSGKSTFLDAISFVLFNKPFRNISKNQLVNSVNQKNMVVECEFSVSNKQYLVRRGISPNVFEIYVDGDMINQDSHVKDYQDVLEKQILKFNYKSFSQIVVLGASNFVSFMQLKPAERRVIIENLLDIEVFSIMNNILKEKQSANRDELFFIESEISAINNSIALHKKYIEEVNKNNEELIADNLQKIETSRQQQQELKDANGKISTQIEELRTTINDKRDLTKKISSINDIIKNLNSKKSNTEKSKIFYEQNDQCPTCSQTIAEDVKLEKIGALSSSLTEISDGLGQAVDFLQAYNSKLAAISTVESQILELENKIIKNKNSNNAIEQFIKKIKEESAKLEKKFISENSVDILELEAKLLAQENKKIVALSDREVHNCISILLKDGGVKSKIIKQYLPIIKKYTNNFLLSMNFYMDFNIDEEFNEKIVAKGKDNFSYASFSEGEKQRIDLALLFTWRTIAKLKNSINTNLLILDEVFDSYLDTSATESVLQLLNNDMLKNANIFVISHKETISDKFDSTIKFKKINGFSEAEI